MKKVATSFRLTEEAVRLIDELAEAGGVTKTGALEAAIRQAARTHRLPPPRKALPKRNPKRKAAEYARVYRSPARVLFVKELPCSVHGCPDMRIENAHAVGGGMGRKADFDKILPLCRDHHSELHRRGSASFERYYKLDLLACAIVTESLWQESTRGIK